MDPRLLETYLRELRFMEALGEEFASEHPKIAARLGMVAGSIADRYVNRLLETSAFVNARMQMRFDDEFPLLTQALLSSVYPNYLSPTPSISVARLYPGGKAAGFMSGHTIPRGVELTSLRLPAGEKTACIFRTTQDVSLYPIDLVEGRLTHVPPDIQGQDRYVPPHRRVRGALRLRLRTLEGVPFSSLQGLDRLQIHLAGDERVASHLHELIHTGAVASVVGEPGRFSEAGYAPHVVSSSPVVQDGLSAGETVLPLATPSLLGHNLVHEYFSCPSRFYFFTLTGLQAGLARIKGSEAEIVVLLDRATNALAERVNASMFALFCTPVVNFFKTRTAAVRTEDIGRVLHLTPFDKPTFDHEVHSVELAIGQVSQEEGSEELPFYPLHAALLHDEEGLGRYFTVRREQRLSKAKGRSYGTRAPYVSTESFLSLVGRDGLPYAPAEDEERINYLSFDVWLTNRDLPGLLDCNGLSDLKLPGSAPLASVGLVRAPSRSRPPLGIGSKAWQLLAQLAIEHAVFDDRYDEPSPGEGLRSLLRLYLSADMPALRRQVDSLSSATLAPVNCVVPHATPPMVRALECAVTFDEDGFDGTSPYALGLVLEHYLARHASRHSYTKTLLLSKQRGRLAEWAPRPGTRSTA
ncbi:type VI secretion system baseplate subunit TssF [Caballeronia sp. GAFFF1]|uniref:type VI secretion system baseplate subunit TssF n=1 Tax=Caballeronia sp. GAFFF1 TaxID=2921779 RepID=UPI002028FFDA|nr:type VI secretion system baseplate subunit TssF [Caballeronia sp. GAFFF1]